MTAKLRAVRDPARSDGAVFGEPYETPDGTTVIPVSHPVGVFVIHGGDVKWEPAVDTTRVLLIGAMTGLMAATLGTLAVLRKPPWPEVTIRKSR
jgi:UDP-glucose 4-epimerase